MYGSPELIKLLQGYYVWESVIPGDYQFDMHRIHPQKQKEVASIYNVVKTILI